MDVATAVSSALRDHPGVQSVRLVGSRGEARAHAFSDWDFAVETSLFESVALELPAVFAPLRPLAQQWDPYATHACYMLMFRGPTKVDLLFLDEPREWSGRWQVTAESVEAIDRHFWDWIVWLEQKRRGDHDDVLRKGLRDMHELMLKPMCVEVAPMTIDEALDSYLDARARLERQFGVVVPRQLEIEVLPALRRSS